MADLRSNFIGIKSPNPFWLASAPPTDKEYNVVRAFKAGWGGVVWKTLGEEGPPIVNVNGPRYGAVYGADRRAARPQQHRAHHRPSARGEPAGDQEGQARVAGPRDGRLAHGALRRGVRGRTSCKRVEETEARRDRAELRLPARHERARHGVRRRPGARIHRDGHPLVQAEHPHAGDREADAQHHRHPLPGAGGEEGRRGCGHPHQHDDLDHLRRPRQLRRAVDRREGHPRRLLRAGGEAHRAQHGGRDRAGSGDAGAADQRDRRRHHVARRGGVHRAVGAATCRSARRP